METVLDDGAANIVIFSTDTTARPLANLHRYSCGGLSYSATGFVAGKYVVSPFRQRNC